MADISKCNGIGCTLSESCYRFTEKAHPTRQSYANFQQDPVTLECENYWIDFSKLIFVDNSQSIPIYMKEK